jgi:hypothetical protein
MLILRNLEQRIITGWRVVPVATPDGTGLSDIAAVPNAPQLWMVGSFIDGTAKRALAMHRC